MDVVYIVNAVMALYATLLAAGVPAVNSPDGFIVVSDVNRILCGAAAAVTAFVMVTAVNLRVQGDVDSWKAEQRVISAGGAAGVFIIFTLAAGEEGDTAFGSAGAVFLLLFLACGLLLEIPIGWARREDEKNKLKEQG